MQSKSTKEIILYDNDKSFTSPIKNAWYTGVYKNHLEVLYCSCIGE